MNPAHPAADTKAQKGTGSNPRAVADFQCAAWTKAGDCWHALRIHSQNNRYVRKKEKKGTQGLGRQLYAVVRKAGPMRQDI